MIGTITITCSGLFAATGYASAAKPGPKAYRQYFPQPHFDARSLTMRVQKYVFPMIAWLSVAIVFTAVAIEIMRFGG